MKDRESINRTYNPLASKIEQKPKRVYSADSHFPEISSSLTRREFSVKTTTQGEIMITKIKSKKPIELESINGKPLAYVLQTFAGETPVSLLDKNDMKKPSELFGGNSLIDLYNAAGRIRKDRIPGESRMQFLLRRAGIEMTTEDVITGIDIGRNIDWSNVPNPIKQDIKQYVAVEKDKPIELLDSQDYSYNFAFLNGKKLFQSSKSENKLSNRTRRNELEMLVEEAGFIRTPTTEVIEKIKNKESVNWDEVNSETIRKVLIRIATVKNKPAYALNIDELNANYKFLNKGNIQSLLIHMQDHPERNNRDIRSFLFEKVQMEKEVIEDLKDDISVQWKTMPPVLINKILHIAADQTKPPIAVSLINGEDLRNTAYKFTNGRPLRGLLAFAEKLEQDPQNPKSTMKKLKEYAVIEKPVLRDVVDAIRKDRKISFDEIPNKVIRGLISATARSVDKRGYYFNATDFHEKYQILRGRSLTNVYEYIKGHEERGETPIIDYLFEKVGMHEELIQDKSDGETIDWKRIPRGLVKHMLQRVVSESPVPINTAVLEQYHLKKNFTFLNENSLEDLIRFGESLKVRGDRRKRSTMENLLEYAHLEPDIESTIEAYSNDIDLSRRGLPPTVIYQLLDRCANELGIPVSSVDYYTLRNNFSFLNGHTLNELASYFNDISVTGRLPLTLEIYQLGGYKTQTEKEVREMYRNGIFVPKNELSITLEKKLLKEAGRYLYKSERKLNINDILHTPMPFLNGKTLYPLYQANVAKQEDMTKSSFQIWLESTVGKPRLKENKFNGESISDIYTLVFKNEILDDLYNADKKRLFVNRTSSKFFYDVQHTGVTKTTLQNEIYRQLQSYLHNKKPKSVEEITNFMQTTLENYKDKTLTMWYKQRTLATPTTGDGSETIADVIQIDSRKRRKTIFDRRIMQPMQRLTPLQDELVSEILHYEQTFTSVLPQLQAKYGSSLDVKSLQEIYEDALVLLLPPERQSAA